MKYPYKVKYNGVWYSAGVEIPCESPSPIIEVNEEKPIEEKTIVEKAIESFQEPKSERKYSKTEITRMTTKELQKLAKEQGIANYKEKSGAELKKLFFQTLF